MKTTKRIRRNIETTIRLARTYNHDSHFHLASVLVKKNRMISVGKNYRHKTHPQSTNRFSTIHAELDCLLGCSADDLYNSTLFVARVGFHGRSKVVMSKPCKDCQKYIIHSGVSRVYYTVNDDILGFWNVKENIHKEFNYE